LEELPIRKFYGVEKWLLKKCINWIFGVELKVNH
jgi:hypothetical protein